MKQHESNSGHGRCTSTEFPTSTDLRGSLDYLLSNPDWAVGKTAQDVTLADLIGTLKDNHQQSPAVTVEPHGIHP